MRTFLDGETLSDDEYAIYTTNKCPDCGYDLVDTPDANIKGCTNTVVCGGLYRDMGDSTAQRARNAGPGSHP